MGADEDDAEVTKVDTSPHGGKQLQEVEEMGEGENEDGIVAPAEELLYDPDDDIIDSD